MIVTIMRFGLAIALLVLAFLRELANPDNPFVQRQMDEWDRPPRNAEPADDEDA